MKDFNVGETVRMNQNFSLSDFEFFDVFIFARNKRVPSWEERKVFYTNRSTFTVLDTEWPKMLIRDNMTLVEYSVRMSGWVTV